MTKILPLRLESQLIKYSMPPKILLAAIALLFSLILVSTRPTRSGFSFLYQVPYLPLSLLLIHTSDVPHHYLHGVNVWEVFLHSSLLRFSFMLFVLTPFCLVVSELGELTPLPLFFFFEFLLLLLLMSDWPSSECQASLTMASLLGGAIYCAG